jgi:hypothetical protein
MRSSVGSWNLSDFEFADFLTREYGPKEPSLMALAALLVSVAQLIVAIVALRRK